MSGSDVVVLAVKPDVIPAVLEEIAPHLTETSLVVSIAAGVPLAVLEEVRDAESLTGKPSETHTNTTRHRSPRQQRPELEVRALKLKAFATQAGRRARVQTPTCVCARERHSCVVKL